MTIALTTLKRGKLKRKETRTVFRPLQVLDVELSQALPALGSKGSYYGEAFLLVRLHSHPIAQVVVGLEQPITPQALATDLWQGLSPSINTFLKRHGLAPATSLADPHLEDLGLSLNAKREAFRAQAPLGSVVICSHHAEHLEACLTSVLNLDYPNFEVILVDVAPQTVRVKQLAEKFQAAGAPLRYLLEPTSSLSAARHRALEHVKGEFVAYLRHNEVVDRFWLLELGQVFARDKSVGAVSGLVVPAELEYQAQVWCEALQNHYRGHGFTPLRFVKQQPFSLFSINTGANIAFRASVLRELGSARASSTQLENSTVLLDTLMAGRTVLYHPSAITRQYYPRDVAALRAQLYRQGMGLSARALHSLHKYPQLYFKLGGLTQEVLTYLFGTIKEQSSVTTLPKNLRTIQRRGFLQGLNTYTQHRNRTPHPTPDLVIHKKTAK